MNRIDKLAITTWGLWSCLGFYRGNQYYKKEYQKEFLRNKKKQYYYITHLGYSLGGAAFYAFPLSMGITFAHEIYNLESAIRGLESDD
jgi:hypothetical protein